MLRHAEQLAYSAGVWIEYEAFQEASGSGEKMDGQTSTYDLVERFKRGDTEAFSLVFQKYQRRLAVLVYYKMSTELRGAMEVDDILQEVFLAAARDMKQFTYQSPGSLMGWLSRIADHVIVDAARYQNREKRRAEEMLRLDRKSTRLNSSHSQISYAVFCL